MSRYSNIFLLSLLASTALLLSCIEGNYEGDPMFSLYVEDSPALDVESFNIQIDKVEISTDNSQWVGIDVKVKEFDILQYVGGISLNVASGIVPKGDYKKLRVTFLDNAILETFEFFPNTKLDPDKATQTFDINYTADDNVQHIEMIDIDVPSSLIEIDTLNYIFAPAVALIDINQGAVEAILATKQGTGVDATAFAINARMLVTATDSEGVVRQTYTSQKGGRLFVRLKEGTYNLDITPMSDDFEHQPCKVENVKITYSNVTNLKTIYIEKIVLEPEA